MGGKLMQTLPKECGVVNMVPCSKCEGYMDENIILLGIDEEKSDLAACDRHRREWEQSRRPKDGPYIPGRNGEIFRTGHFLVMAEQWVRRTINPPELRDQILKCRWTFVGNELCEMLLKDAEKQVAALPDNEEGGEDAEEG
jgi:hypothetical protein